MTDIEKLICLIDEVKYTSRNAIGVDEFEPQLVQLLAFIKAHQELRPNVVHNFQLMIQDGSFGPYTIIEFCMHELRWQEMRSEIEKFYLIRKDKILKEKLYGNSLQHLHFLEDALDAFTDSWESKDLFKYYEKAPELDLTRQP